MGSHDRCEYSPNIGLKDLDLAFFCALSLRLVGTFDAQKGSKLMFSGTFDAQKGCLTHVSRDV